MRLRPRAQPTGPPATSDSVGSGGAATYNDGMPSAAGPEWVIREDANVAVILALALRQVIGVRWPDELPPLRGLPSNEVERDEAEQARLERQWREYWAMTVEPQAHHASGPLELVEGFDTYVALPVEGFDDLRAAIAPHTDTVAFASAAHNRYAGDAPGRSGVRRPTRSNNWSSTTAGPSRLLAVSR